MYWQNDLTENPDKQLEDEITKIHMRKQSYGYERV